MQYACDTGRTRANSPPNPPRRGHAAGAPSAETTAAQNVAALLPDAILQTAMADERAIMARSASQSRRLLAAQPIVDLEQWRRAAQ
jgi:hypothetical protein